MSYGRFLLIRRKDKRLLGKIEADLSQLEPKLPANRIYRIGIDQSTSNTGFYLTDQDCTFHFIGDMSPNGSERHRFYADMRSFISRLLDGRAVDLCAIEKPIPYGSGKRNKVLMELKKEINTWKGLIPAFRGLSADRYVDVDIGTWKKHMVNPKKGKGRTRSKSLMAEDMVEKFPELAPLLSFYSPSTDYDAFDAFGILQGHLVERNIGGSEDNYVEKIGGSKDFRGDIQVYYKLLSMEEISNVPYFLEGFEEVCEVFGTQFYASDQEISWYDNVKKAATAREFTMTAVESFKHRVMLQWLLGFPRTDKHLMAFIIRKNALPSVLEKDLSQKYLNELVTW